MREQDFLPPRPGLRERLLFVSVELRAAAAAAASAAALAMFAFVIAAIPPVQASAIPAARQGLHAAAVLA